MPESKQEEEKPKNSLQDPTVEVTKSMRILAALAMKDASTPQKIAIFFGYGIIGLGIIGLWIPPFQALKQLIILALIAVVLIIILFFAVRRYGEVGKGDTGRPASPPLLPLPPYKADRLKTMLEETRKEAFKFLRRNNQVLSDNDVRANIFFPVCDASGKQNKNKLKIYSDLYCKMDSPEEREITFKPKQGATGRVFTDGQRRVVQRLPSGSGDWEDVYNITDKLAAIIHPDLKWIISMPLIGTDKKPIGVVNVDGLRCEFPTDVLSTCMRNLTNHMSIMNQLLIFG